MPRATWLKPVLAAGGLELVEFDGWETRGVDRLYPEAVVRHHTATGTNWTDQAVANLLALKGNVTTPPPLSQLGLDRRGRFWLIASGRCNHNGYGIFGNDAIGIEAFNDGRGEPWPDVQVDAYDLGVALILEHLNLPTARDLAHFETDPGRKSDPRGFDMDARRARVAAIRRDLNDPITPPEDPDVYFISSKSSGLVWLFEPGRRTLIGPAADTTIKRDMAEIAKAAGISTDYAEVSDERFERLADGRTRHQ